MCVEGCELVHFKYSGVIRQAPESYQLCSCAPFFHRLRSFTPCFYLCFCMSLPLFSTVSTTFHLSAISFFFMSVFICPLRALSPQSLSLWSLFHFILAQTTRHPCQRRTMNVSISFSFYFSCPFSLLYLSLYHNN